MLAPDVSWHGVWVKRVGTKLYGRIANVEYVGILEFDGNGGFRYTWKWPEDVPYAWVVWENGTNKREKSAELVECSDLWVLPVEPEPWYTHERQAWLEAKAYSNGQR